MASLVGIGAPWASPETVERAAAADSVTDERSIELRLPITVHLEPTDDQFEIPVRTASGTVFDNIRIDSLECRSPGTCSLDLAPAPERGRHWDLKGFVDIRLSVRNDESVRERARDRCSYLDATTIEDVSLSGAQVFPAALAIAIAAWRSGGLPALAAAVGTSVPEAGAGVAVVGWLGVLAVAGAIATFLTVNAFLSTYAEYKDAPCEVRAAAALTIQDFLSTWDEGSATVQACAVRSTISGWRLRGCGETSIRQPRGLGVGNRLKGPDPTLRSEQTLVLDYCILGKPGDIDSSPPARYRFCDEPSYLWKRGPAMVNPLGGMTSYMLSGGSEVRTADCTPAPSSIVLSWLDEHPSGELYSRLRWTFTFEEPPEEIVGGIATPLSLTGRIEGTYESGPNPAAGGSYRIGLRSIEAATDVIRESIDLSGARLFGGPTEVKETATILFPKSAAADSKRIIWTRASIGTTAMDGCAVAWEYTFVGAE